MKELTITQTPISQLHGDANNPKQHNRRQLRKIADSIREFGFINPILVDENFEIIAGHGRLAAAQALNMADVPVIILSHLSDAQKRLYRIADNKLTELGKWSIDALGLKIRFTPKNINNN